MDKKLKSFMSDSKIVKKVQLELKSAKRLTLQIK